MPKKQKIKKPIVVVVSGGFDPIHPGHVRMFQGAKKLGDKLIVIINNDNWIKLKKGHGFMSAKERAEIIAAFGAVDEVFITKHKKNTKDMSICSELRLIQPDIFANGGDRTIKNIPEAEVCRQIGCRMVFNVGSGGKINSSSWLLSEYVSKDRASKKRL